MSGHLQRTPATRNFPKGAWEARWQEEVDGRKKWRGRTFPTKREAERHLAAVITDIDRGEHIARHESGRRLQEAADLWVGSWGEHGGQLRHDNFYNRCWKHAVASAGLPTALRFHDLQHTYASLLVRAGVHVKEMSVLMGHASAQITLDRYSHMWAGTELEVAARLDALRFAEEG